MKALGIPTGKNAKTVSIKDRTGRILCTVYFDPMDTTFEARYLTAKKTMDRVCKRLSKVSINADGSPVSMRYALSVNAAEREIKQAIMRLLPIDNPDGLFETRRPFASVKGAFYCTHVLNALTQAVRKAAEPDRA